MIYRLYYDPDSEDESDTAHRYCEFLLGFALFRERQLCYQQQTIVRNEWGKPALQDYPQIQFNISHCKGLVSCILSDTPVGIDVEYVRPYSPFTAMHVLGAQELDDVTRAPDPDRRFFMYWTLKESCVKAMGLGLAYSMKKVVFCIEDDTVRCLTQPEYRFVLLEDASPYITAVCYQEIGKSVHVYENV